METQTTLNDFGKLTTYASQLRSSSLRLERNCDYYKRNENKFIFQQNLKDKLQNDLMDTKYTASKVKSFKKFLNDLLLSHQNLDYGSQIIYQKELETIFNGRDYGACFYDMHPSLCYYLDLIKAPLVDASIIMNLNDLELQRSIVRCRSLYFHISEHGITEDLIIEDSVTSFRFLLFAYLLNLSNGQPRKLRRVYYKLIHLVCDLSLDLLPFLNLDCFQQVDGLVAFRRDLTIYLLMTMNLLDGYPCEFTRPVHQINDETFEWISGDAIHNIETAQEQVFNSESQCLYAVDDLVQTWDRISDKYDLKTMVELANSAKEQGLLDFTVTHSVDGESKEFITENLNKLAHGLTNLYTTSLRSMSSLMEEGFSNMRQLVAYIVGAILVGVATYYKIKLIGKLFSFFIEFIFGIGSSYVNMAREHSFDCESESWNGPLLLFLSVFGVSSAALSNSKCMNLIRVLSTLPRAESGIESLFKWIKQTYDSCWRLFSRYFLGVDPGIKVFAEHHPVAKWIDELDDSYQRYVKGIFSYDSASFSIVHSLFLRGLELQRSTAFRSDYNAIRTGMMCLNKIMEEFRTKNVTAGSVRNPPVVVYLNGNSGVGKSTLTNILAASVISRVTNGIDLKKQWKNLIYARASEQEFWDGYTGQLVTVFDDFSQRADTAGNPNVELFDIIRAANVYPYPLHMATLTEKGNTNFTSKMIICSSNLKKPKSESLNFPEALMNRFDVSVKVTRNARYEGQRPKHYCDDFYVFEEYDMKTGKTKGQLTWTELVDRCVEIYHDRAEFVESLEGMIDNILSSPLYTKTEATQRRVEGYLPVPQEEVAEEQVNCERLGYCDCEIWNEEPCLMLPKPKTKWIMDKFKRISNWITGKYEEMDVPEAFERLHELSTSYVHKAQSRWSSWVKDLKERYPFLAHAKLMAFAVGLIVTGPLIFFGISKLLENKSEIIKIEPLRSEGYSAASVKPNKMETYTSPSVKPNRVEGYSTPTTKPNHVEMSFPDGKVNGRELNLAAQQFEHFASSIVTQGVSDQNAAEICSKVLTRNLFKIFLESDNFEPVPLGHVLFLKGRIGIMPHHYVHAIRIMTPVRVNPRVTYKNLFLARAFTSTVDGLLNTVQPIDSPELTGTMLETRDLCAFSVSNATTFPDISGIFVNRTDVAHVMSSNIVLPTLSVPTNGVAFAALKVGRAESGVQREDCRVYGSTETDRIRLIRHCWKYSLETQSGDCGAPLIVRNPQIPGRKVLGIHIAGNPNFGYSTPLYQEDIDLILKRFDPSLQVASEQCGPVNMPQGSHIPESQVFVCLDRLSTPLHAATKTVITPSPLHGILSEVKTKPCLLRDTASFSPMDYRLRKFASDVVPIDDKMVNCAERAVSHHIISAIRKKKDLITTADKSVYTFEEAVQGLTGEEFLNAVKRKSSPGYPFVLERDWSAKERIFGPGPDFRCDTEQAQLLKEKVMSIIEDAKSGVRQRHVFVDTLKDERKPIHKAHKTRMFSACPLDYLIACKMYFGGVVSVISKARNDCGISVGTNVYSYDWTLIAHVLHSKSKNLIAGDFEGFDSSQMQDVLRAAGNVLKSIAKEILNATEEDLLVMQVLLESLLSSVHVNKNLIYQWFKGLPSGHFLTAIINSIFVLLSFNMAWQIAFGVGITRAFEFFEVCGIVAYGDDHIVSVPEWATNMFNQFSLIEIFKKIGLSYTLEDKDASVTQPHRSLSEVSFLKRKFLWDDGRHRFLSPLAIESILETPMWVKKCADVNLQTTTEVENSLKELSLHPVEVWNSHIEDFRRGLKLLGSFSRFCDREFAQASVLNENM